MKDLLRILCAALCLMLIPLPAPAEEAAASDSAPVIRVLLRRLNLTDRADLTLDGVYTASGENVPAMAFPKGAQVIVQIREGALYLFYEGMSMRAGTSLRLTRNASADKSSEGIRFTQGGSFYPGDLLLTVEGGVLTPVLSISVEEYLLGVVPYEMSNAFPLEALKAQAVCARTYALSHVDTTRAYDVVDTTNDQVFKGVDLKQENAVRAVKETAGVVGVYKGALAVCYYSASNGGQTELVENVWSGKGDWGYYQMTDDPYDLENPESVVKRARLNKSGEKIPDAFRTLLASAMQEELASRGLDTAAESFRVDKIESASLGGGKFAAPSRMVTELTLTFAWSGREILQTPAPSVAPTPAEQDIALFATPTASLTPSPTVNSLFAPATDTPSPTPAPTPEPTPLYSEFIPAEESATVTLPLFPDTIRALNLSISGSDNEIVTLSETTEQFVLEARRYGHGVGMSQRGAQWMAGQYDKTFAEILSFYYPGMELKRVAAGEAALPTVEPALAATPAPPATPTPRPTLMPVTAAVTGDEYLASVEGIEDDSSLNLRAEPNTAADILMRLYKHQQLIVVEACEEEGWVKVRTDVVEGYVMSSFLQKVE